MPEDGPRDSARPGSGRVLAAYAVLVAASHVLWISFASVTADAAHAYGTTELAIGLLVSVGPICSAVFSVPAGAVADRYGYRRPLLWAGAATVLFATLRPAAPGFPVLLLLTVGLLVPQPFLINAVADLVNRHYPEDEAALATGFGTMSIFLGITIGLVATPVLVGAVGVRGCQLVYAALALAALLAFWRIAPAQVPPRLATSGELGVGAAVVRVLRSRTLWKLSVALFLGFGCYLGITTSTWSGTWPRSPRCWWPQPCSGSSCLPHCRSPSRRPPRSPSWDHSWRARPWASC
jgi:MFS family permease